MRVQRQEQDGVEVAKTTGAELVKNYRGPRRTAQVDLPHRIEQHLRVQ